MRDTKDTKDTEIAKCSYCEKERPVSEMKKSKLIYRRNKQVQQDYRWYCSDSSCAGYDQMAHEG